ncbi:MAG: YihY/virulence factor BrkB family protein [Planctomycetota bacterium]
MGPRRRERDRKTIGERVVEAERRLIELPGKLVAMVLVVFYAIREFHQDLGLDRAATLSFSTLISLIPLIVLFFSFAGRLGGGDQIIRFVEGNVLEFVAPEVHDDIRGWLNSNISRDAFGEDKTGIVNIGAIVALLTAAVGLLTSAERIFNRIWKAKGHRSYWKKLAAFWIILTTSPFLIAASLFINGLLLPKGGALDTLIEDYGWIKALYDVVIPFLVALLGITMLYVFLPATKVRMRSAVVGGVVAASLWSLSKAGFYIYVSNATTARNLYGQLATVPSSCSGSTSPG